MTTAPIGLIAILRGLTPAEAPSVGDALYSAGLRAIEVPLNSPDPLDSVRALRARLPEDCRVGAGTVLTPGQVASAADAGAQMIVAPNTDPAVVSAAAERGLACYPGAATPTEAFTAVAAGASALKLFPADHVGVSGMKAWSSVLPAGTPLLPVGGVDETNLGEWLAAGAAGAGIGSSLYRPGDDPGTVAERARALAACWTRHTR